MCSKQHLNMERSNHSEFKIPVLDFSPFSVDKDEENVSKEQLMSIADDLCDAFRNVGFVYLKNFGISQEKINELQNVARYFFQLPQDIKEKYSREGTNSNHGWVALEREILNLERPGDLKEAYNVTPSMAKIWPNDAVPEFESTVMGVFNKCTLLSNRIMYLMGLGLKLKNPSLFRDTHNPLDNPCPTTLRLLYYPVVNPNTVKANQIRCGEHSDYGAITLLFQDEVGGLEVMNTSGEFVPATPIEDTVLVNVADLMQRWTSDHLVSTKHRVVLPAAEIGRSKPRISLAYFVHPDDDTLVECVDGSNKYEPITSLEYLQRKLDATYAY